MSFLAQVRTGQRTGSRNLEAAGRLCRRARGSGLIDTKAWVGLSHSHVQMPRRPYPQALPWQLSHLSEHQNHLGEFPGGPEVKAPHFQCNSLKQIVAPTPESLVQWAWGGAQEFAFLMCSQESDASGTGTTRENHGSTQFSYTWKDSQIYHRRRTLWGQ